MVIKGHIEQLAMRWWRAWAGTHRDVGHHHGGDFEHGEFFNRSLRRCPGGGGLRTTQHGQNHGADQERAGKPAMTNGVNVHGVLRPKIKGENSRGNFHSNH